jgi:uncharacterized membrane protein YjfL (UPF0719 family)
MMNLIALSGLAASRQEFDFGHLLKAYAVNIGWAVAGGIGMGLGLIVALKVFTLLTRDVDEWALVKQNNLGMSIILSAVVLGTSLVIMMMASPGR